MKLPAPSLGAIVSVATIVLLAASPLPAWSQSDAAIKKAIVQESIATYPRNCPCPYSSARNGSRCGRRSAYNRAGGYAPLCYDSDVTAEMVRAYRARQH